MTATISKKSDLRVKNYIGITSTNAIYEFMPRFLIRRCYFKPVKTNNDLLEWIVEPS